MGASFIAQLLRAMSGILEEHMHPSHTSNPREAKSPGAAEHLERRQPAPRTAPPRPRRHSLRHPPRRRASRLHRRLVAALVDLAEQELAPLVVVAGPTASGKTALALALAEQFSGEIVSCDSVAVYRGMEIGTAKPTLAERARVPHHLIDIASPDQPCTAGDYSRLARQAIREISQRGRLPIVCGGTGLYLRALSMASSPRRRAVNHCAKSSASAPNSVARPTCTASSPASIPPPPASSTPTTHPSSSAPSRSRWPPDSRLATMRPPQATSPSPTSGKRAATRSPASASSASASTLPAPNSMSASTAAPPGCSIRRSTRPRGGGLIEETAQLLARYGPDCRPLASLGYAQAAALLRGELSRDQAIAAAQQGHRNYAKRQLTWFRKDPALHWLPGFGSAPKTIQQAVRPRRPPPQNPIALDLGCMKWATM